MKYWVYLNGEVPGSYEPEELAALGGFIDSSMVCPAEGGYEVRNWRRAGEFPEIVSALQAREKRQPAAAPPMSPSDAVRGAAHAVPSTADDILNDASSRIFRHVSELMKELENRREERALTQSLQRQVAELKNELQALRERNKFLQDRADLIPGYEAKVEKLEARSTELVADRSEKERVISEQDHRLKAADQELQGVRLNETKLADDLKRQTRLYEDISEQLAAKEYSLAKAFGLIRRLESELAEILPGAVAGIRRELPEYVEDRPGAPTGPADVAPDRAQALGSIAPPEAERPFPEAASAPYAQAPAEVPSPVVARTQAEPDRPTVESVLPALEEVLPAAPHMTSDDKSPGLMGETDRQLPAEGEIRPVPAPWQAALDRLKGHVWSFLTLKPVRGGLPAPKAPEPKEPPPPPAA